EKGLERLLHGRTAIVIAHRLSTIRRAGKIVVLEAGGIAEQGTHEELIEANGVYAKLYGAGEKKAGAEGVGGGRRLPPGAAAGQVRDAALSAATRAGCGRRREGRV